MSPKEFKFPRKINIYFHKFSFMLSKKFQVLLLLKFTKYWLSLKSHKMHFKCSQQQLNVFHGAATSDPTDKPRAKTVFYCSLLCNRFLASFVLKKISLKKFLEAGVKAKQLEHQPRSLLMLRSWVHIVHDGGL